MDKMTQGERIDYLVGYFTDMMEARERSAKSSAN